MSNEKAIVLGLAAVGLTHMILQQQSQQAEDQMRAYMASQEPQSAPDDNGKSNLWAAGFDILGTVFADDIADAKGKVTSGVSGWLSGLFGGGKDQPQPVDTLSFETYLPASFRQAMGSTAAPTSGARDVGVAGIDFAAKERQYGLPSGYLRRTAEIESAMNPAAQNPRSSAGGLFQFIDSTARQYGLQDRFEPVQATDAAARLARDNSRQLERALGRKPTGAELYLAHQQGGGGASKLLRDRNVKANTVVSSAAVRLNGGNQNMTAGQFADLWINKFNRSA